MKKAALVIGVILVLSGAFYLFWESADENNAPKAAALDSDATILMEKPEESTAAPYGEQEAEERDLEAESLIGEMTEEQKKSELMLVKNEMDELMQRYERNLSNVEQRKVIKQEMDVLLRRYDKLVLQDAMNKVKKSNG